MMHQRNPPQPRNRSRNAYAEDMLRKEREAVRRQQSIHNKHEHKSSRWFPSLLIACFAVALFVIAYAIS
jgi:hypothetical protein